MKILDRGVYKEAKICIACKKPFTIRKKWKNTFDQVKYCSTRCQKSKK